LGEYWAFQRPRWVFGIIACRIHVSIAWLIQYFTAATGEKILAMGKRDDAVRSRDRRGNRVHHVMRLLSAILSV
jgi:hypothetical protein